MTLQIGTLRLAPRPRPEPDGGDATFSPCPIVLGIAARPVDEIRAAALAVAAEPLRRVRVGGLPVAVMTRAETALHTAGRALRRRGAGGACDFHTTVNGQVVSLCASSGHVRDLYEQADVISPDGMSVVLASRARCPEPLPERVATTDGFHDVAALAQRLGLRFYFLGADDRSCHKAVERVRSLYPGVTIAGCRSGYFAAEDEAAVVARINAARPDVLWVGMGVPRQQDFIVRNRQALTGVGVARTCGGLFDFLSGRADRAPDWMQRAGLEWLYRAWREPARLGPRYLSTNPHALWHLVGNSGRWDGP